MPGRKTARREGPDVRLEHLRARCAEHGLPFTSPRRVVLQAILALDTHPTADEVYAQAARLRPGIARATVYRTLDTFVRLGVITKACHPGASVRYDPEVRQHHHLICMGCDRVIDICDERLDALPVPDTSGMGFVVSDLRVQLRGLCRNCIPKEETP